MELIDVIRGRWLALAIAAPIIAGIVALTLLTSLAGSEYTASATLAVPQALGASSSDHSSLQTLLEDFTSTFESQNVADGVAADLDLENSVVRNSTDASAIGGSEVTLTVTASSRDVAEPLLRAVTSAALRRLADNELDRATIRLDAAERQLDDALADLADIETQAGTTDVPGAYSQRSTDVQNLRTEIARAVGSPTLQSSLRALLDDKTAEAQALSGLVTEWELNRNRVSEASAARDQAERDQYGVETVLARVDTDVQALRVEIDSSSAVGQAAIPTLAAMFMALGAVVVVAILSNRDATQR